MSIYATVVGVAAAVCTTAVNVPQLKKAWTTGQTDDISMNMPAGHRRRSNILQKAMNFVGAATLASNGGLPLARPTQMTTEFLDIPKGQCEPGIEPDRVADDFWREAVALKRYRFHPMMLIGNEPQSYLP